MNNIGYLRLIIILLGIFIIGAFYLCMRINIPVHGSDTMSNAELIETKKELTDMKIKLKQAQKELADVKEELKTTSVLDQKIWNWRDYGKKASVYQDYLQELLGAEKYDDSRRPHFPEELF